MKSTGLKKTGIFYIPEALRNPWFRGKMGCVKNMLKGRRSNGSKQAVCGTG
jgi:hypothetical protein